LETGPYANPAQAALALRRALAGDPANPTFRTGLMELYRRQGRFDEARVLGEEGLAAGITGGDLRRILGLVYAEMGATEPLLALVRSGPDAGTAALEAGTHAISESQWDTGLALLDVSLAADPGNGAGWLTATKALLHSHRLEEAADLAGWLHGQPCADAGDLRAQAGFLKGVALMLQGRLPEGLPWLENRFAMDGGPRPEALPLAPWEGGDPAGKTLLLQAEQGYGDLFMMARYVGVLARQGARVYLRPQPTTQGVLATCEGLAGLAEGTLTLPAGALQANVMSLPRLCGTRLETIPAPVPYLHVPGHVPSREAIDACLAAVGADRKVGLVWAGNPTHNQDRERSMPPELLDLLEGVPGVAWCDLQIRADARPSLPMLDLQRHLTDFADTAYALSRLDLLISVDSSPVHLAGALGRPVWMALAWLPDWRWLLARTDTPWYPTVELWRQPAPGDWVTVIEGMRARLGEGGLTGA